MEESVAPRTLLEAIIRQRQVSLQEAADLVAETTRAHEKAVVSISRRHLGRLARGERAGTWPNPATRRALQHTFGRPIDELLAPYHPGDLLDIASADSDPGCQPREVLTMAADRARRFMAGLQTMSDEAMGLVYDDVRELVRAYPIRPLPEVLGQLVSAQDTVFSLLERRQRPVHARQLYFLAGVLGGLLAKASHDLADPSAALTQLRTAWLCAEQADHDGLRAWIAGQQSLVSYWAQRPHDSVRYAQRGADCARHAGNTASVWLPANEARAWAVLGNAEAARDATERAERAWDHVRPDELDELGGLATFSRPRQLYYAADTLSWLPTEVAAADDYAHQAIAAYPDLTHPECDFGGAAGSRAALALGRITRGDIEGATEALGPVFDLPTDKRTNGVTQSVHRVHRALTTVPAGTAAGELQERIEDFTRTPLRTLPR